MDHIASDCCHIRRWLQGYSGAAHFSLRLRSHSAEPECIVSHWPTVASSWLHDIPSTGLNFEPSNVNLSFCAFEM